MAEMHHRDLIMMIRDKNNIFERVENFHADLAWNYPFVSLNVFVLAYAPPKRDEGAPCHLVEVQKGCTYNGVPSTTNCLLCLRKGKLLGDEHQN